MPIDASIYSQIQQPEDPISKYAKLAQIQNMQGQGRLQELQATGLQTKLDEEQAVKKAFGNLQPGQDISSILPDVLRASPSQGLALQKSALENRNITSQINERKIPALAGSLAMVLSAPTDDPEKFKQAVIQGGNAYTAATGEDHTAVTNHLLSLPPDQAKQFILSTAASNPHGQAALKMIFPEGESKTTTTSPDYMSTNVTTNKSSALGSSNLRSPSQNTQTRQNIDLSKVSRADMDAGYRYFVDGTLPPNMGRGIQGTAQATHIREIAGAIGDSLGVAPEDVRANQLSFKGSGAALTQLIKREAQVGANVRQFDFNSQQVLDLSKKIHSSGVPLINAWINAGGRAVAGDPDLSALDVAIKTTVNEFAQIVSGTTSAATTEGEKQKAEKLLNAAQTPNAQIPSVINQMRIESQNRMKSFMEQKQEVLKNMKPGAKPTVSGGSASTENSPYVETRVTASGKRLGKKADGTIEEIK